jgi:hypothetical protein
MARVITREIVTSTWIWDTISDGKEVCTFEIAATILIYLISLFIFFNFSSDPYEHKTYGGY